MTLPRRAWVVWGTVVTVGLVTLGLAVKDTVANGLPNRSQIVVVVVFGALVLVNWLRPLIIFVGNQSEAVQLDEAFFLVLVLLVPTSTTLIAFALATVLAQTIQRRPLIKSTFNFGQVLVSAGAGLGLFHLINTNGGLGYANLGAGVVAALAYFVVNSLTVNGIVIATGVPWRQAVTDGLGVRVLFTASGVAIALGVAVTVSAHLWALPIAVVPFVILRQVLVGHFEARHDRARFEGLYESTLSINRSMGTAEVAAAVTGAARDLLRCADATLVEDRSGEPRPQDKSTLVAPFIVPDRRLSLTVSGRSRTEPFDKTDRDVLDALAAVGSTALANAALYEESRFQRRRLAAITSSLGEGVCAVSRSGLITFMNPAASAMLGSERVDDPGEHELSPDLDIGPRAPSFILAPAMRAMSKCDTITSYDTRFQRADGSFFHVAFTVSPIFDDDVAVGESGRGESAPTPNGAVLVFRDITERKMFEEQLTRHAFHDALTGLPNRRLFLDHLEHALRRSKRSNEEHAVLFADVDRFKIINDSLGHHAGDQLLIGIGERLRSALRPGDVLARFGGDEFTVLLEGVDSHEDPVAVAQRILDRVRDPISLPDGHEVVATVSIGIAVTSPDKTRDDVLHDADVAMYQAKARGRGGRYEVFDIEAMGVRSAERIELEAALHRALERDELEVYYQPLFDVGDRKIVGAEALVRWNHPTRGLLEPDSFIGLAEDTGLILPLGRVVLGKACRQAREWNDRFGVRLSMGVNLSARQFQQQNLVEELEEVLRTTGADPSQLLLEITESLAADRADRTIEILLRIKALGCEVAIDDFGTGYSALGYLADFPIDVVKVDRSFTDGVDVDPVKSAIVSAVVTLSKAIGTTAVVEGVESAEQLEHLHSLGCQVAQGYYFARPMPAERFEAEFLQSEDSYAPEHAVQLTVSR